MRSRHNFLGAGAGAMKKQGVSGSEKGRAGATGEGAAGAAAPPPPVASWAPFLQNLQKRKFLDKK